MKDNYTKPSIYFEDFELSQSIAANCKFISTDGGKTVVDPETGLVTYVTSDCEFTPPGTNDSECYHVPGVGPNVFSS